ncbi:MAG TPA: homoserine dehydrogenase [Thermoplasmatales archaeon]|nr:homoserine dehydrogenase [Thermoplasmatales archaeon]
MEWKIAFVGFGTVGQGFAEILLEKKELLRERFGLNYKIVAISDMLKGSVYNPGGLDIKKVLDMVKAGKKLDDYPSGVKGMDALTTIKETDSNVIVEVTYTDVKTGEPALTHVRTALENGKHVISTNKGPPVKAVKELKKLAEKNGVFYGFEGVVLAGTPVFSLLEFCLAGNIIKEVKGIVNGTTNYILTKMEEGMSYEDALKKAQELGYAEADPTGDVEGWDALGKIVILSNVIFNADLRWEDVPKEGITNITLGDVESAKAEGKRWKLIASAKVNEDGIVEAKVGPEKLPLDNPLAGVSGATNALTFVTDELGPVTIVGPGAGRRETGFSLLIDLINLNRRIG